MVADTPYEELIAGIWSALFGGMPVHPDSSFFEIGGDSLSMVQMLFEVESSLGVALPPSLLFDHPTLREFAGAIGAIAFETVQDMEEGVI